MGTSQFLSFRVQCPDQPLNRSENFASAPNARVIWAETGAQRVKDILSFRFHRRKTLADASELLNGGRIVFWALHPIILLRGSPRRMYDCEHTKKPFSSGPRFVN